jgi:hypothetical protein
LSKTKINNKMTASDLTAGTVLDVFQEVSYPPVESAQDDGPPKE